jgi:transcriptional regulator with XRE-family HTH domain
MSIGADILKHRQLLKLTQRELAARCDCTITCISAIETGRNLPGHSRIVLELARFLGVTAGELLDRIEAERPTRPARGKPRAQRTSTIVDA